MSQRLATYNHGYLTRSCRQQQQQQCFYGNAVAATENVLAAAAAVSGHEVARDFAYDREDNSRSHGYKILQQQIIGRTIQSVEDIEKWLRYTSEHISNPELSVISNTQAGLERGLNEHLSEADKELLTDIELAAKKSNIDFDAILTELQNNRDLPAIEKDDFTLPDLHLDDLILNQEIPVTYPESEFTNTDINLENLSDKSVEAEEVQNEVVQKNQESKNNKTDVEDSVDKNSFDTTLTISIQDLSIDNDSSDGSSDPNSCTNFENKSENQNLPVVTKKKSSRCNRKSKSTNSSNVTSKFQPSIIKRKRKVNNQDNIVEDNTISSSTLLDEESSNENDKTFANKSPRSSTSESSGSESDDLCKGRNPSFVTAQELVISKALQSVGITEDSLEYFYNSENIKTWRCHLKDCGRDFAKLCYLKVHLMTHMNVKPFKCDYSGCSWAFYSEFKLKRHKETHLNKKDYVCPVPGCERRFTTIYNLASHEKLHSRPNKLACQVSDCGAKFQTKRALENHMRSHDESYAPYACNYEACGKRFHSTNALMTHQRCHSYSLDDLKCSWPGCGKTFDQPCRKKVHMRTHTGQKPFPCTFKGCGWAFATSSKLKRHQKKHTNDRSYACREDGCSKAFMRPEHLREHKLTHTEERVAFQCHDCSASFAAKSSLYAHMKNHADKGYVHNKRQRKRNVEKKSNDRSSKLSESESSVSAEETENLSSLADMPVANVVLHKMYKCPVESCSKWYSHRSSLRVHLRKHASAPLSEIQNGNEANLEENAKKNEGAARTEFTREYVLSLKPDRQINEVGTVELSEGILCNKAVPSVYCQEDVGLPAYQILLLDAGNVDGVLQVLD